MKTNLSRACCVGLLLACLAGIANPAYGQVNSFTNSGSGTFKWETGVNWSLNIPPESGQSVFITNFVNAVAFSRFRTVAVDSTTAASPLTMTVSNLTVAGVGSFSGSHNNLFLNNAGPVTPLVVQDSLTISANGTVNITNSVLSVWSGLFIDNGLFLNTGTLATDALACDIFCFTVGALTVVGHNGSGSLTMTDGRWDSGPVQLGSSLTTFGTLTISGGSVTMEGSTFVTLVPLNIANGTVWLTGGALDINGGPEIGSTIGEAGQMVVSNGTWTVNNPVLIGLGGGSGTLTVAGGTVSQSQIVLGRDANSSGIVWITGGELDPGDIRIGVDGSGLMTLSNGTVNTATAFLGDGPGSGGTLTMAGGDFNVGAWMYLSAVDCSATGVVNMTGGNLTITNGGTALLQINSGTFNLSGGTLRVDKIVITNCAQFVHTGGTLIYGSVVLDPNGDADGDGIPNGYEQSHGLDPLDPSDANKDTDGDGMSNLQEYLAGTDPTNSASVFHITSVIRTNNDVRITWMMGSGKTNALQAVTVSGNGSYATNAFTTFTTIFTVTNTVGTTTNFLDVGGATNTPARYYRVRLVP